MGGGPMGGGAIGGGGTASLALSEDEQLALALELSLKDLAKGGQGGGHGHELTAGGSDDEGADAAIEEGRRRALREEEEMRRQEERRGEAARAQRLCELRDAAWTVGHNGHPANGHPANGHPGNLAAPRALVAAAAGGAVVGVRGGGDANAQLLL